MKITGVLLLAGAVLAGCWVGVRAQEAGVQRKNFWTVELLESRKMEVSAGDMILVKPQSYALVPANLKKTFAVSYDHALLRLIAEEPPEGEGRLGRQYYFAVLSAGTVAIRIQIKEHEQVVETLTLEISSK
jgi:hypothetical protein